MIDHFLYIFHNLYTFCTKITFLRRCALTGSVLWGIMGKKFGGFFMGELIMFLILCAVIYFFYIAPIMKKYKEHVAKSLESCITYDEKERTLKLYHFHPNIRKVVKMEPYEIVNTSYQPDTVTYTSVTVGQVTTGGVTHNEGYLYDSGLTKTEKFQLNYMDHSINTIELCTPEVKEQAEKLGLQEYYNNKGQIEVVQKVKVSKTAVDMAIMGIISTMQREMMPGYPSREKCSQILDFLCTGSN